MSQSQPDSPRGQASCFGILNCLSAKETVREKKESYAQKRASRRIGVERPMRVIHHQPHLVEPMKLTVYDVLPPTPVTAQATVSKFVHQSRKSLSRASTRTSFVTRKQAITRPNVAKPQPALAADDCQLRRNPSFRPLQLSIYNEQRLSDLPEFDQVSFTEAGEIRFPPRALVRTQSEEMLTRHTPAVPRSTYAKPASMFEQTLSRRMSHVRNDTESTIVSNSRPPSSYDALHSHPISWYSTLPGLPSTMQFAMAPDQGKKILSPMKEEFTPPPSGAVMINGKVLAFPEVDVHRIPTEMAHRSLLPPAIGQESDLAAPAPIVDPGPNRRTTIIAKHKMKISQSASIVLASSTALRTRTNTLEQAQATSPQPADLQQAPPAEEPRSYFHTDFKTNTRINQWLNNDTNNKDEATTRSRNSSVSTVKTTTTSSSFAEHRRKRSQFYQLNHNKAQTPSPVDQVTSAAAKPIKTPTPLNLYTPFPRQKAINTNANAVDRGHARSPSSSAKSHTRTQTTSTVASTVATDVLFEQPETPELIHEDRQPAQQPARRAYDAESVTTVDMKSRTGTMKSTITSHSYHQVVTGPDTIPIHLEEEVKPEGKTIAVTTTGFVFRGSTPSPSPSPRTPLSAKTKDVEKMMFEMCAQGGYRRVNVGLAF
ncbi:hypothetical protein LTR64_000895 [Lithohypha guttulata]|uniref:uncharacterized protein n=1 Tax=Lithohypha guttulata TaxID=1690604 RepID=UPI002DDE6CB0|nr:hypothetical protein LTR51_003089 [Lithohypha guttulata]